MTTTEVEVQLYSGEAHVCIEWEGQSECVMFGIDYDALADLADKTTEALANLKGFNYLDVAARDIVRGDIIAGFDQPVARVYWTGEPEKSLRGINCLMMEFVIVADQTISILRRIE